MFVVNSLRAHLTTTLRIHQLMNLYSLFLIVLVVLRLPDPYSNIPLTLDLNILSVVLVLISFHLHAFSSDM